MGWELRSPSRLSALLVSLETNWVHISQSGKIRSTALSPIHDAKLSLSHRSFHHAIVTRSPNHMCAISWEMMAAIRCRTWTDVRSGSTSSTTSR